MVQPDNNGVYHKPVVEDWTGLQTRTHTFYRTQHHKDTEVNQITNTHTLFIESVGLSSCTRLPLDTTLCETRLGRTCVGTLAIVWSPLGWCGGEVGGEEPGAR